MGVVRVKSPAVAGGRLDVRAPRQAGHKEGRGGLAWRSPGRTSKERDVQHMRQFTNSTDHSLQPSTESTDGSARGLCSIVYVAHRLGVRHVRHSYRTSKSAEEMFNRALPGCSSSNSAV